MALITTHAYRAKLGERTAVAFQIHCDRCKKPMEDHKSYRDAVVALGREPYAVIHRPDGSVKLR